MFRDLEKDAASTGLKTHQRSDAELAHYLAEHAQIFTPVVRPPAVGFSSLVRRLLLSCLVDADHSDTARHYGNEQPIEPPPFLLPTAWRLWTVTWKTSPPKPNG